MKIAVIADDLTGANVDGALLTAKGFFSATCLDLCHWDAETFSGADAVAISVDSRLLTPADAAKRVSDAVCSLAEHRPALVAKRIDSTLRGNLGAEIESALAAMDAAGAGCFNGSGPAVAVVVPVYPGSGRIAVGGFLIVHGTALQCSPIAKDPANPLFSSSVADIIASQTSLPLGAIDLNTVLRGPEAVKAEATRLVETDCRILICDAVTDDDVAAIAASFKDFPRPLLSVDPGPFTAELAAVLVPPSGIEFEDRILAIIGSTSQLTRRQIEALRLAHPTHIVKVNTRKLLDAASRTAEIESAVKAIITGSTGATVLGVCTAEKAEDVLPLEDLSNETRMSTSEISETINAALAEIAQRLLAKQELRIGGLYTSGGEVTVSVIRRLAGKGFSVRDEVLPLAVYGHLLGGLQADLPMVTKGGFVGDTGSLVECVAYLFTKISTRTRQSLS